MRENVFLEALFGFIAKVEFLVDFKVNSCTLDLPGWS